MNLKLTKDRFLYALSYYTDYPFAKPERVNFGITDRCNLKCRMCKVSRQKHRPKEELTLPELRRILDELVEWGVPRVSIAGGESLIKQKTTLGFIRYAKQRGLEIDLITNGTLITQNIAEKLLETGLDRISISIDGATPETNDFIRGEGTFRKIMRAAGILSNLKENRDHSVELEFNVVVMRPNIPELVDLYHLMCNSGFGYITYQALVEDNRLRKFRAYPPEPGGNELWPTPDQIPILRAQVDKLLDLYSSGRIINSELYLKSLEDYFIKRSVEGRCLAGYKTMHIDPYGFVNVCGFGPNLNIRNRSIKKAWSDPQYKRTRQRVRNCKQKCLMLCYEKLEFK